MIILPRTDHIKLSMHFSAGLLVHFISLPFFQVTYCSSRWFAILGPFPAATFDFSNPFSDLPRKRSPPCSDCFKIIMLSNSVWYVYAQSWWNLVRISRFFSKIVPTPLTSSNMPWPNCMYFTRFSPTRATILATILATIFINGRYIGDYFPKWKLSCDYFRQWPPGPSGPLAETTILNDNFARQLWS